MKRTYIVMRFSYGFIMTLVSLVWASTALAQSPGLPSPLLPPSLETFAATLPPAPVLSVSAGILPTSPFYLLDRFDEWMQRNIFSFGVPSIRAQIALSQASERVAELQALDDRGERTSKLTRELVDENARLLLAAATVAGNEFQNGGRPAQLAQNVILTTLASSDALDRVLQDEELLNISTLEPGDTVEDLNADPGFSTQALDLTEDTVMAAVFAHASEVPDQFLRLVASEELARTIRNAERSIADVNATDPNIVTLIAAPELAQRDVQFLEQAQEAYGRGDMARVMVLAKEARTVNHWLASDRIRLATSALRTDPQAAQHIRAMIDVLVTDGLLPASQRGNVEQRTQSLLADIRAGRQPVITPISFSVPAPSP